MTPRTGGRGFVVALSAYGAAVFAAMWVGLAVGLATGGALFADTWTWLTSLEPVAAVIVWILTLPIAVALWAWSANLAPVAAVAAAAGLLGWTLLAVSGAMRTFRQS